MCHNAETQNHLVVLYTGPCSQLWMDYITAALEMCEIIYLQLQMCAWVRKNIMLMPNALDLEEAAREFIANSENPDNAF